MSKTLAGLAFATAIAALGATASVALAGNESSASASCEIQAKASGGTLTIAGVLHSNVALSGRYALSITNSQSNNDMDVDQRGDFSAKPGETRTLDSMEFSGDLGVLTVVLEIDAPGADLKCAQSFQS
jgi:hypothetical protein